MGAAECCVARVRGARRGAKAGCVRSQTPLKLRATVWNVIILRVLKNMLMVIIKV